MSIFDTTQSPDPNASLSIRVGSALQDLPGASDDHSHSDDHRTTHAQPIWNLRDKLTEIAIISKNMLMYGIM